MFIYALISYFIVNKPYLLPSLTNFLTATIYGVLYLSVHIVDYDTVDTFEFYYLIISLSVLSTILFYSLLDSTIFQRNSVSSIVFYVGSFGSLKMIFQFIYQARYIKKH